MDLWLGSWPYVAAGAALVVVAAFVYLTGPGRTTNRLLGLALFLDGASWLANGLRNAVADEGVFLGLLTLDWAAWFGGTFAYLAFLGTLDTPLVRPLRRPAVRVGLAASATGLILAWLVRPDWFDHGVRVAQKPGGTLLLQTNDPQGFVFVYAGVLLLGLVASWHAWRIAGRGTAARRRAGSYTLAFTFRDLPLLLVSTGWILIPNSDDTVVASRFVVENVVLGPSLVTFAALLVYGVVRTQILGIELKVKWGIRRGTVLSFFVAAFFVVSESAALFFGHRMGPYLGIVAAGLLLFGIAPLQRLAERVADAAMPHVSDTPEYHRARGREVYKAALEEAMADGALSEKDRNLLATLADHLGLGARETLEIERHVHQVSLDTLSGRAR